MLRRFKGSEACRFSTRVALNILKHIETGDGPQFLWDPFCGTGLIPSVGLFAYAARFDGVIASDINPCAVQCARANMSLFREPGEMEQRLREVRVRQKAYVRQTENWRAVARYIEEIRPVLEVQRQQQPSSYAFTSSALALPRLGLKGQIHFVADLPYGTMCRLQGGTLGEVIPSILQVYPDASITFVLLRKALKEIHLDGSHTVNCRPLKKGRVILQVRARRRAAFTLTGTNGPNHGQNKILSDLSGRKYLLRSTGRSIVVQNPR